MFDQICHSDWVSVVILRRQCYFVLSLIREEHFQATAIIHVSNLLGNVHDHVLA